MSSNSAPWFVSEISEYVRNIFHICNLGATACLYSRKKVSWVDSSIRPKKLNGKDAIIQLSALFRLSKCPAIPWMATEEMTRFFSQEKPAHSQRIFGDARFSMILLRSQLARCHEWKRTLADVSSSGLISG